MITTCLLLFFELVSAVLGFLVYTAMNDFDDSVISAVLDNMTPYKRDNLVAAQRTHEIAANALMVWNVICMFAFVFTIIANL